LNKDIDKDTALGKGFEIGHSYFCNLKNADKQILSGIVEYEIIPLIQEYWFDNQSKVDEWSKKLEDIVK
jgi:5-methylcytosine-specific restriction protein B